MTAALRSEWRKVMSTKMWWVILLCVAGYMAFIAIVMAGAFHFAPTEFSTPASGGQEAAVPPDLVAKMIYAFPASMAYAGPALIGALLVTGEYRHATFTPTFLAEPRRGLVLGAKLVVGAVLGVIYGAVIVIVTAGTGAGTFALLGDPTYLGEAGVAASLGRSVLALALWAVVGVGFGALLRNQVAAIVVLLVFTQFVEPMLRMVPAMTGVAMGWLKFLPGAAGEGVAGNSLYSLMDPTTITTLSTLPATATLAAYALALAALGYVVSLRRDIS
jgi:hypothetical protein